MEQSSKTLTFVVPAYNMETYLERCVESLLSATDNSDIEVLIVDDGSSDGTPELADMYERRWPGNVRAIHQSTRATAARSTPASPTRPACMSRSWTPTTGWTRLHRHAHGHAAVQRVATDPVDMIVTNYVYDKVGKRVKHTVNFRHAMATNTVVGWDDLAASRRRIHTDARADLPHPGGARLRHAAARAQFYVDFIYAYQPFPWVKSMLYMDIPFYHYFIGARGRAYRPT